ncbi:autotransporter domain-containing protein [Candidatus Avelusimicrobium stercoris]|uniref:autotransporter family protein n=1 Tax=Candidatus Avelusimicrobium stercoris TaxID=1947924 RepID=UPI003D12569A
MNPILHKTLALTLSASLLATYGTPAFAAHEIITEETTLSDVDYKNYTDGAILNESKLTTRNVNFSTNSTNDLGGAIENKDYNAQLNIQGGTFANNTANAGGALFLRGNTTITNTEFRDNNAVDSEAGAGAIYLALHKKGNPLNTLQMNNVAFTNNSAKASNAEGGGAVGLFSKADLNYVTFTGNTVEGGTGGGGAMFLGAESLTTLNQNTFKDNMSSINGGALATREHDKANNKLAKLDIVDSNFAGNKAAEKGGAFYNTFYNSNTKEGFVSISNTSFTNNEANEGGAIYNNGKVDKGGNKGALTIAGSTFDGNKGTSYGGAISNWGTLTINANSSFTNNNSPLGGAILTHADLSLEDTIFSQNNAPGRGEDEPGRGGALFTNDITAGSGRGTALTDIKNTTFKANTSDEGGAIFQNNAFIKIDGGKFLDNKASSQGGAILQATPAPGPKDAGGKLTILNSEFITNTAADGAGAIGVYSEAEITKTSFTNNESTMNQGEGGAIYVGGWGQLTMKDSSFTGNKGNRGGAIASTNQGQGTPEDPVAYIKLDNVTFADNIASEEGGAIANYLIGGNGNPNTIKNSTFTGNKAGTKGGAIFNANKAVLNLEGNNTFADNTANGVANDIHNDGTLNINSGTTTLAGGITGNGALNVKGSSVLNLGQSTAEADSIAFDNGATLAVEFGNDTMGNLKANTITIGENASDSAKLLVTLSRDFLTDTTGISHELTNGTDVKNGSFAMADASNALYNVTFDNNIVTAVRKTQEETNKEIANAGGNANNANVINAFTNSSDMGSDAANQTADVINRLAQTDVSAAVAATNAVAPEAASAKQVVHGSIAREVFNSLQTRMDTAANAAPQAFALDDEQKVQKQGSYSIWMQGLLNKSHKEAADTAAFTGSSTGLAFGADTAVNDDILLGAGYAYTHTNVSSDGRHDRILGDNFFVYGQYRPSRFYVQASLGYGDSKYEEAKYLPGLNVNADYHVKSYSAQATAGYELTDMFTPTLGLRYINLQQEGYKDSADQAVSAEQNSYLSGVLGVTLKNEVYASSALRLLPQLHAGLSYDFVSDNAQGNVVLPNGSNYSISGERLHRLGFEAGASVSAYLSDNWEALLGYEGNFRQDYNSHTGTLKVRYLF